MKNSRVTFAARGPLQQGMVVDHFKPCPWLVKTLLGLASTPEFHTSEHAVGCNQNGRGQQRIHHPDVGDVPIDGARCSRLVHALASESFCCSSPTTFR